MVEAKNVFKDEEDVVVVIGTVYVYNTPLPFLCFHLSLSDDVSKQYPSNATMSTPIPFTPNPFQTHCPITHHRFCGRVGCFAPFHQLRHQFNDFFCIPCLSTMIHIRCMIKNAPSIREELVWRTKELQERKNPDKRHYQRLCWLHSELASVFCSVYHI